MTVTRYMGCRALRRSFSQDSVHDAFKARGLQSQDPVGSTFPGGVRLIWRSQ